MGTDIVRLYGAPTPSEGYIYKEQGSTKLLSKMGRQAPTAQKDARTKLNSRCLLINESLKVYWQNVWMRGLTGES